jgi:universal stress protein E
MTRGYAKILVAIRDLDHMGAAPLKAAALAARAARIELFHVLTGPVTIPVAGVGKARESMLAGMQALVTHARRRLERVAKAPALRNHRVSVHVTWDHPPADSIVRRALTIGADLVIAGIQERRFAGRLLLVNSDWELIRECPCALLLTHAAGRYRGNAVIAAVDPFHANDKPAYLDKRLLDTARAASIALDADLHLFHAYTPLAALVAAASIQAMPLFMPDDDADHYARRIHRKVDALARRARIPEANCHVGPGDVTLRLQDVVRRTRADLIVMGALSRSGLKRVFVGNTAERVLDRLPCDMLVVKPRGFRTRVARVSRSYRTAR